LFGVFVGFFGAEPLRFSPEGNGRPDVACFVGHVFSTSLVSPGSEQAPKGAEMTEWYFVWVESARGPAPQKWSSDALWGQLGRQDIIVRFSLTEREAKLSLEELAKLHPIPTITSRAPREP
jgi:hypothetical protein